MKIGAGAIVLKSMPENVTVVGVPGDRVIYNSDRFLGDDYNVKLR